MPTIRVYLNVLNSELTPWRNGLMLALWSKWTNIGFFKHRVFSSNPLASYIFLVYVLLYILWLIHIDDKCKDVVMIKKTVILYIKVKCYNISHKESFNENMHKSILFYFVIRIEIKTFIPDHDRYTYTTHVIYNWRNSCNAAPK